MMALMQLLKQLNTIQTVLQTSLLYHYTDGVKAYIIAPKGLEVGQRIVSGPDADIKVGNALPLANIPVGTVIHNIELKPGKGAELGPFRWCFCSSFGSRR